MKCLCFIVWQSTLKMGSNFLWLVLVTLVSLKGWSCHGCWEQEKLALLHLKLSFGDPFFYLENWNGNDSSDCCQWNSVECNTTTGRVIRLSLSSVSDQVLYLNSLFLPFEELKSLDLSYDGIVGFFQDKGSGGQLSNLEFLDLSYNELNESILWSLEGFSSLKSLNLEGNAFSSKGIENISKLTSLETLKLGFNTLNYSVLSYLSGLPSLKTLNLDGVSFKGRNHLEDPLNLKNLESLSFGWYSIRKSCLQTIGSMPSLKVLSLRGCNLSGALPAKGVCELIHLKELDISNNNFSGNLPWCFSNLTSLERLDLSANQFSGNIALSPLQSLTSIQNLFLYNNQFQIPLSLKPFLNLSKLKNIDASYNQVYDDRELYSSAPKFQLNTISMSCFGNAGELPKFLYYQHDLREVDLSNINLLGDFPSWLLENNTRLQRLNLRNNSFSGALQMPFQPLNNLSFLDLSDNLLHGYIEYDREIGTYLSGLKFLFISRNSFIGGIPSSFGDMKSLESLDASNNELSGEIPEHFAMGCHSLTSLSLSNNHLEGQILPPKCSWVSLETLRLDGNRFNGKIPESLLNCSSLQDLHISDNYLSGTVPRWLGNMTICGELLMANNNFEGPVPIELYQLSFLESLDLSGNNISGSLLPFSSPLMSGIHLSRNRLEGPLDAICNSSHYVVTLDLGNNYFTGKIPDCFGKRRELSFLLLNKNKLEGEIPTQLCNLSQLGIIDLSHNYLSGRIPACLNLISLEETFEDKHVGPKNRPFFYNYPNPPVGFTTKGLFYFYESSILAYMTGIDLSSNQLTGEIPHEIGNLTKIHALNISHNSLVGPIPPTLNNLGLIESLDLSHNNLSGEIPPHLVELYSLAFFSVAYNNLSGKTPARIRQFATFEESSYKGNPFLCGEPLPNSCSAKAPGPEPVSKAQNGPTDVGFVDMEVFYVSFIVSYIVMLLSLVAVLYINPYWRRAWFYYIEMSYSSCYYFVVDHLP